MLGLLEAGEVVPFLTTDLQEKISLILTQLIMIDKVILNLAIRPAFIPEPMHNLTWPDAFENSPGSAQPTSGSFAAKDCGVFHVPDRSPARVQDRL